VESVLKRQECFKKVKILIKKEKRVLTKEKKYSILILVPRKRDTDNGNLIERGNERKAQIRNNKIGVNLNL
jgi:hypothetical protein